MVKKLVAVLALISSSAFAQSTVKNYNLEVTCGYEPVKLYSLLSERFEEQPLFIGMMELNEKITKTAVLFLNPVKKTGTLVFYRTNTEVCVMPISKIDFEMKKNEQTN